MAPAMLLPACERSSRPHTANGAAPNVVLISVDSLRADHLHCYGYPRETSPQIDRLATEGALFEQHISSTSWTLPAHAAMFTGLPDSVHGLTDCDRRLHPGRVTLAERLHHQGFATAGFFSGPFLHPAFGLDQGFDTYVDCSSYGLDTDRFLAAKRTLRGDDPVSRESHADVTNPTVLRNVRAWLGNDPPQPFFLFIHLWDVHFDYLPPAPYDTMFDPDYDGNVTGENFFFDARINADMPERDRAHLLALYDGEIAWTDHHVGLMVDELRRRGLLDDSILLVTSDHGTEFFEHRGKGHRMTLFEEVIAVPLIVRYPKLVPAGVRVPALTRTIDVAPTIVDLAGLARSGDMMGRSLRALTGTAAPPANEIAISELRSVGRDLRVFRGPSWKVYVDLTQRQSYFFDLRADPGEQTPVTDPGGPAAAARMQAGAAEAALNAQAQRRALPVLPPKVPADVMQKLKSLGYVGDE